MSKRKALFKFAPLSTKQKMVMCWWQPNSPYHDKKGIICDGSIRSGKTTVMSLSYVMWAMENFDGENFALCGKTIQSLRRNVIKQLLKILRSRKYKVQEHRSENSITIRKNGKENEFYLFGGKDEGSQDLIQGITLAGVFFDEVALMPESFVNQAVGRCSVEGAKYWFNCNPEGPDHFFKKDWIDRIKERNLIRIHFTMRDNLSLSEETLKTYESQFRGVFYERFILGLWVVASGLIFRYFAENDKPYLFRDDDIFDSQGKLKEGFYKIIMGIDFGGSGSMTTFCLTGYRKGYHNIFALEEDGLALSDNIDAKQICDKFIEFYRMAIKKYGRVDWIFPDSASPTMINSLRSAALAA
ncbi:MAG: PBSX family phage terminase large subunit, partial [Lachnospiraceae bacterium]|nr:PBSX family phage terminase large subunit [Lachnospiraceae bacterium]